MRDWMQAHPSPWVRESADLFCEQGVAGGEFLGSSLDSTGIKDVGVAKWGARQHILKAVRELLAQEDEKEEEAKAKEAPQQDARHHAEAMVAAKAPKRRAMH